MLSKQMQKPSFDERIRDEVRKYGYSPTKRADLKYVGEVALGAAGLYLLTQMPEASGQEIGSLGGYANGDSSSKEILTKKNGGYLTDSSPKADNSSKVDSSPNQSPAQTVTAPTEIDVGTLVVPFDFDHFSGITEKEWYTDSIDYVSSPNLVGNPQNPPQFHFRSKYSDFTYEVLDTSAKPLCSYCSSLEASSVLFYFYFDTKSTGDLNHGADGVYNLGIRVAGSESVEIDGVNVSNGEIYFAGTPLSKQLGGKYTKGKEYDYNFFWGPSPLSPDNHLQLEVKILTDILTNNAKANSKGDKQINYFAGFEDDNIQNGGDAFLSFNYLPMVFESVPLDEFSGLAATLFASIGLGAAATKRDFISAILRNNEFAKTYGALKKLLS
jgi:hypothetical protein